MSGKKTIKVIILAGGNDFGRCRLAVDLPTALWPVAGKPALQRLLDSLANQGVQETVVCFSGGGSMLAESMHVNGSIKARFLKEALPSGTAGALRDAAEGQTDATFIVYPAAIVSPPKIDALLKAHQEGQCDLTVAFNPGTGNGRTMGEACGIYVCSGSVLEHIPNEGYFDIKEGLIPEMVRVGKSVHAAVLPGSVGNFRDRREYLNAIADYLECLERPGKNPGEYEQRGSDNVWIAASARVHSAAKICGPVIIMDGAEVSEGAVILGPALLESNACIEADAAVIDSVVWENARLEPNCQVRRCLIGNRAVVGRDSVVRGESVSFQRGKVLRRHTKRTAKSTGGNMRDPRKKIHSKLPDWARLSESKNGIFLGIGLVLTAFLWCYSPELTDLWRKWQSSDEYSSGLLVPFLAVYVLWTRRKQISRGRIRPSIWWGIVAFVGAQAFRLLGLFFMVRTAEWISIVLSVGALVLLLFGWRIVREVFTVLMFLFLMIPWPKGIQDAVAQPLQRWATTSAVFCLEMLGYGVVQHGNVIDIEGTVVEVAWACNGLRMVTAFFVISGLVVLLVKRTWWEKLIVFISSLPVALLCNTIRLTLTSIAFTILEGERWEEIFHDFGGYAMMPLALAAMVGELWLLRKLTTAPENREAVIITRHDA
ncbi:MAG: exosortase [Sedimentisphaerales bacterium]|nr:exosortase [Sedimentisphaerales bacterium]